MRTRLIGFILGGTILIGASAAPAINCEQVRRYASTGRTVESIAETMIVDVSEVKKCLESEGGGAAATPKADAK